MTPLHLAAFLAAAPFLPHGKGALILIFGGLAVLPISLLWSRSNVETPWFAGVEQAASRLGLGASRLVSGDQQRCVVTLLSCASCRVVGHAGCEPERLGLQQAIRGQAPRATVTEVDCNGLGHGVCTFDIRRRGRSP